MRRPVHPIDRCRRNHSAMVRRPRAPRAETRGLRGAAANQLRRRRACAAEGMQARVRPRRAARNSPRRRQKCCRCTRSDCA